MTKRDAREFDVIAYGATGFTGRLICDYLQQQYGSSLRWAIAGRDVDRLAAIGLGASVPLIAADALDPASVRAMTARTHGLISTVGPYQVHGSSAVAACAATGTDYVDMAGEPVWMREMIDAHGDAARASGARILFSCGFDSIPFDMSVHRLQQLCIARWGQPSSRVRCFVRGLQGGISGGTSATRRATEAAIVARPEIMKAFDDPFLLTPDWHGPDQPQVTAVAFDDSIDRWVSPFYMAFINTKHVHRTNMLSDFSYGRDFSYDEAVASLLPGEDGRLAAEARTAFDPFAGTEHMASGDGPSAAERAQNYFDLIFLADGPGETRIALSCASDRDPGYEATARMMVEAILCTIATDSPGGCWTPAALLGDRLIERLENHAGIRFAEEDPATAFNQKDHQR